MALTKVHCAVSIVLSLRGIATIVRVIRSDAGWLLAIAPTVDYTAADVVALTG